MYQIQQITDNPAQKQTLILFDGSLLNITLVFVPLQYGWFLRELTYGTFKLQNQRICVSPNMLRQFKNQIPFGMACFSKGSREPSLQQDFSSGNCTMYILTAAEVAEYEAILSG